MTYCSRHKLHFLAVKVLTILSRPGDWPEARLSFPLAAPIALPDGPGGAGVEADPAGHRFFHDGPAGWTEAGPDLDASLISGEAGRASTPPSLAPSSAWRPSKSGRAAAYLLRHYPDHAPAP